MTPAQVILTGNSHHVVPTVSAAGEEPTPAEAAAQVTLRQATVTEEVQQPLRVYWEYLSYLFLRVPALSDEEDLEKGYRDYLQVRGRTQIECIVGQGQGQSAERLPAGGGSG